jgi:hypothetical protein
MQLNAKSVRALTTIMYFSFAYGTLFFYASDNIFCAPSRTGQTRAAVTAKLAFALTVWDIVAVLCGALTLRVLRKQSLWPGVIVGTLVAGFGFASIPFWIYRGYGRFLLENTWADLSCFFTEGYGLMFPFVVAPVLALATLIQEWILLKIPRVGARTYSSGSG